MTGREDGRQDHAHPAARDRREEDEGPQRQRPRSRRQDHRGLRPLDGPARSWRPKHMAKQPKRIKAWTGDRDAALRRRRRHRSWSRPTPTPSSTRPIEIAVNLGVDPRHADQQVRGVVNLPSGTGRDVRVAVIAKDAKADEATRRRRRHRRRRGPGRADPGRLHGLRPRHRHPGHDGPGRPSR